MSVAELEKRAFENLNALSREPCCHSLDVLGRSLCGAELTGTKPPHPIGDCCVEGHKRCRACDSLMEIDGDLPGCLEAA